MKTVKTYKPQWLVRRELNGITRVCFRWSLLGHMDMTMFAPDLPRSPGGRRMPLEEARRYYRRLRARGFKPATEDNADRCPEYGHLRS